MERPYFLKELQLESNRCWRILRYSVDEFEYEMDEVCERLWFSFNLSWGRYLPGKLTDQELKEDETLGLIRCYD